MPARTVAPISTMSEASIDELLAEVLRPFLRLLLESGISEAMLASGLRLTFADVTSRKIEIPSIRLGTQQRQCMEAMCLWRRHPNFLGKDGQPRDLQFSGQSGSFSELCRMVAPGRSPTELLDTLTEFGAVRISEKGLICAVTPTFLLGSHKNAGRMATDGVLKQLAGFLRVVEFNVRHSLEGLRRRFERTCTVVVAEEHVPVFERAVQVRGQLFIDALDEWLERHRDTVSPTGRYVEVGAGAYFVDLGNLGASQTKPIKNN